MRPPLHTGPRVPLLLRAMQQIGTTSGAALSPEHYARLAALGSALRYGEFVVSEVRHLVA
ncbi:hypothetical protein [Streptomyces sp. NPDC050759]|uniref:hypothetical protein n=1 Tax=Streptomyces sp. NPDC050759 TaxID=3365635 RepID=UPI003788D7F5